MLIDGNVDSFWKCHDKQKRAIPGYFSPDFKALVTAMIHPNPDNRATLEDVFASNWINQAAVATLEDAQALYTARELKIMELPVVQIDQPDVEEEEEKKQMPPVYHSRQVVRRSGNNGEVDTARYEAIYEQVKQANKEQVSEFVRVKTFNMNLEVSGPNTVSIFTSFLVLAENMKLKYTIKNDEPYTVTIEVPHRQDPLNDVQTDNHNLAQVQLLKNPDGKDSYFLNF